MKKILYLSILLTYSFVFSQSITVNTSSHTVPQLVNDVLINSPCISATNVTWRTGTNFGSSNGIGYFQNTNPNFPMQSGVILSTGNVLNAVGPNSSILNDGNNGWLGDSELETTLAASGITMSSKNATVLEFDFTPISSQFDFDFIFASEEYGNFQCQFSDAFAFLLTNTNTGVTTNLAVVPGTTDPISVVTIRDFIYNSTCPSANQQYFGLFNGGSNASSASTNYNGQTTTMNASSTLTPGVLYHIKLVIADRTDFQSDSAIFLSSNSFNIGQEVLGDDLTIASDSAICFGQTYTINTGLNPADYTFVWEKDDVIIAGETGPNLVVSQPGSYDVTYTNIALPCQIITNNIKIEYYPEIITPNPVNLYKCDTGAGNYLFNLTYNDAIINNGATTPYQISYFASINDAENNISQLTSNYLSPGNQTIYTKIKDLNTGCYTIKPFDLLLAPPPVANQPATFNVCANSFTSTVGNFNLTLLNPMVLNGQSASIYTISYYQTLSDANTNTNQLLDNFTSGNATIYIKLWVTTNPDCNNITSVDLNVVPLSSVDNPEAVYICNSYILPPLTNGNYFTGSNGSGTPLFAGDVITTSQTIYIYNGGNFPSSCSNNSSFIVTIIIPDDIENYTDNYCDSFTPPSMIYGNYYTGPNGTGTVIPFGTPITTSQTIYFYYQSPVDPTCMIDIPSDITITTTQHVPILANAFDCTSFTLQPLAFGNYYDAPNGGGNMLAPGTVITSTKVIYIYGLTNTCPSQSSFWIVIGTDGFPDSISECVGYTLPILGVGGYYTQPLGQGTNLAAGTFINTSQTIYVYAASQTASNCSDNYSFNVTIILPQIVPPSTLIGCGNYILPPLTVGNYYTATNAGGTMLNAGDTITQSKTIYIYLVDSNGCQNEIAIDIVIKPKPIVDSRSDIDACNSYTLTSLNSGNYYTGSNGTGTMLNGGTVLTTSQQIYIYKTVNGCSAENSFQVNIYSIQATQMPNVTVCDSYVLLALTGNNKYYTQPNKGGTQLFAGNVISTTQTIYVYLESGERNNCYDEKSFVVTVNNTPIVDPAPNVLVCNSYVLPVLNVGNYYTQPLGQGTQLNAGDVITTNQTIYVYAETGTNPNCYDQKSFTTTIFNVDDLPDITICESYTLPNLTIGSYYNGPNGTGGTIPQGSTINTSKTIYVYANSGFAPNCFDETSFDVTIIDTPIAYPVPLANRTVCDEDGTNDGVTNFDLTTLNSFVLGSQTGTEFNAAYFANSTDATANINSFTNTSLQTVYVRISNTLTPNCFDIKPITIIVNKIPEPTPLDGIVCVDSETGNLLNPYVIYSGLSTSNHTFKWFNSAGTIVGTASSYTATQGGVYSIIATNTTTGCSSEETFVTVTDSEPALVSYTINEDFANNQTLTIIAIGTGNYVYQIDNLPFQLSNVFENVTFGNHTVIVKDMNDCGISKTIAVVINYPHYFTPNGDGINDYWNVVGLKDNDTAIISIFDRYGKMIKQMKTSSQGWDGKYNGLDLISDDYWFTINYNKNTEEKEFKSHFALKR